MEQNLNEQVAFLQECMEEKKAENIKLYDVQERNDYTDFIIVCEGSGELHNRAIADNIISRSKEKSIYIMGKEGYSTGTWILIDMVNIIVHIFEPETRKYYDIETIWNASKKLREQSQSESRKEGKNA